MTLTGTEGSLSSVPDTAAGQGRRGMNGHPVGTRPAGTRCRRCLTGLRLLPVLLALLVLSVPAGKATAAEDPLGRPVGVSGSLTARAESIALRRPSPFSLSFGLGALAGDGGADGLGANVGGLGAGLYPLAELHYRSLLLRGNILLAHFASRWNPEDNHCEGGSVDMSEFALDFGLFTNRLHDPVVFRLDTPPFYTAGSFFIGLRHAAANFTSPYLASSKHDFTYGVIGFRVTSNHLLTTQPRPGITWDFDLAFSPSILAGPAGTQPGFLDMAFYFGSRQDRPISVKFGLLLHDYLVPRNSDAQGERGGVCAGLAAVLTYTPWQGKTGLGR